MYTTRIFRDQVVVGEWRRRTNFRWFCCSQTCYFLSGDREQVALLFKRRSRWLYPFILIFSHAPRDQVKVNLIIKNYGCCAVALPCHTVHSPVGRGMVTVVVVGKKEDRFIKKKAQYLCRTHQNPLHACCPPPVI